MVNIQELIQQLLKDGTPQQLTPEQMAALRQAGSTTGSWYSAGGTPTGSGDAWDGRFTAAPDLDQYGIRLNDDFGALYDASGKYIGDDALNKQTPTDLWKQGILASLAMYGGANFLQGYMPGAESGLGAGVEASMTAGGAGGGAVEGIASLGQLSPWAPAALPAITSTVAPLSLAELGIAAIPALPAGVQAMAGEANKTFFDKAGDFLSDPKNLLTTIGTIGSVYEGLKDDPADPNANWTQTTTKTLDPRLQSIIYGADGQSGVLKNLTDWAAKYPTGQNQAMIDAQNGLRGLLTDPRVMNGYFTMGGTGLGLLNQGIAPNPWAPPKG